MSWRLTCVLVALEERIAPMRANPLGMFLSPAALPLLLGSLLLPMFPSPAHADGLPDFIGWTRPGNDPNRPGGQVGMAANQKLADIGGSVYFKVYELGEANQGDPW